MDYQTHPARRLLVLPHFLFLVQSSIPLIASRFLVIRARMSDITFPTGRIFSFRLDDQLESLPVHCDLDVKLRADPMTCGKGMSELSNLLIRRMTNRGP
jgi:hypothetical protein